MMLRSAAALLTLTLIPLVTACGAPAESDTGDDGDGDGSGSGSGDADQDPVCTAATDVVPIDEIASAVTQGGGIGDITRAHDGTIYFMTSTTTTSATIGRRVPCGALEMDWKVVFEPVTDIEVDSDDWLYMASNVAGTGTLSRFDLGNPAVTEHFTTPGERIHDLSAGPNRRMFYVRGATQQAIWYTDGGSPIFAATVGTGRVGVTAASDGNAFTFQDTGSERAMGRLFVAGVASQLDKVLLRPEDDYSVNGLRGDAQNGLYLFRVIDGPSKTFRFYHLPTITGLRSQTFEVTGGTRALPVFAVDGDPTEASLIIPDGPTPLTAVTLPVAVFMP